MLKTLLHLVAVPFFTLDLCHRRIPIEAFQMKHLLRFLTGSGFLPPWTPESALGCSASPKEIGFQVKPLQPQHVGGAGLLCFSLSRSGIEEIDFGALPFLCRENFRGNQVSSNGVFEESDLSFQAGWDNDREHSLCHKGRFKPFHKNPGTVWSHVQEKTFRPRQQGKSGERDTLLNW